MLVKCLERYVFTVDTGFVRGPLVRKGMRSEDAGLRLRPLRGGAPCGRRVGNLA